VKRAVVRLPERLLDRLDVLTRELRALHPRRRFSRAAVARALIASGLTAAGVPDQEAERDAALGQGTPTAVRTDPAEAEK
jgi:hypothetical protein